MKKIYLDYAATTPLDPEVLERMMPFLTGVHGNPSSMHTPGREAKLALDTQRDLVASSLRVTTDEIYFTGSGTESDNLGIIGIAHAYKNQGNHIIISAIEHKAVLNAAKALEKEGFTVSLAPVTCEGFIDVPALLQLITPKTILISIMYVNNEVGTIQPIEKIGKALQKIRNGKPLPLLHTDACQAACLLPIYPKELGVDLLSLNGSKIYGPKGTGCLYARKGIHLEPIIAGGGQESGVRSGTESIAQIAGFAVALDIAQKKRVDEYERLTKLTKKLRQGILNSVTSVFFNTPEANAIPGMLNVSFEQAEGESLLLDLDNYGIYCSTGSACASTDLNPSHVLLAMNVSLELAHASLRFSLGRFTTNEDIDYLLEVLPKVIGRIRAICPTNVIKEKYLN